MDKKLAPGSLCIHGGYRPKNGEPMELPIIQSTTFKYDNSEEMAMLFDLKKEGYFYTRLANPTNDMVAKKICALEGGAGAMLTSSGQAANFYAIFNIAEAGDHIVASTEIYGGTYNLFNVTMRKLGIECTFVNQEASDEEIQAAFRPNTKALFGETISNPGCKILDIERFAGIAHKNGVPLIVDNTFATPVNCRPFEWGCDIVTHSTTKYMDGHATQVGGCVVDSGNFDWEAHADKYPGLCKPDDSYHGLTYTKAFGKMAYTTKLVAQLMRDLGSIPAPQNSFLLNLGLETLHLRMAQHCKNATAVARWLNDDPRVAWVNYSALESDPCHHLHVKYLPNGGCGVIAFALKGDRETAIRFMDSLRMINIATHVADSRSCVLHPASHTHRQLSEEQLAEAGIASDLIRLSCGIEDTADIIADISQALDQVCPLHADAPAAAPATSIPEMPAAQPVTPEPVDDTVRLEDVVAQREAKDFGRAFTINDKYRYIRDLFGGSQANFEEAVANIKRLGSLSDAYSYLLDDLAWDADNETAAEFLNLVAKHFNSTD